MALTSNIWLYLLKMYVYITYGYYTFHVWEIPTEISAWIYRTAPTIVYIQRSREFGLIFCCSKFQHLLTLYCSEHIWPPLLGEKSQAVRNMPLPPPSGWKAADAAETYMDNWRIPLNFVKRFQDDWFLLNIFFGLF